MVICSESGAGTVPKATAAIAMVAEYAPSPATPIPTMMMNMISSISEMPHWRAVRRTEVACADPAERVSRSGVDIAGFRLHTECLGRIARYCDDLHGAEGNEGHRIEGPPER